MKRMQRGFAMMMLAGAACAQAEINLGAAAEAVAGIRDLLAPTGKTKTSERASPTAQESRLASTPSRETETPVDAVPAAARAVVEKPAPKGGLPDAPAATKLVMN